MTASGALIVFARQPIAGMVKTRLGASIGAEAAMNVYARLLDRTIDIATQSRFPNRYLYASQPQCVEYFRGRLDAEQWQVRGQCSGDIGQRMVDAIGRALVDHSFVALIGSDIADFLLEDLNESYAALESTDNGAVLGPSADGGYWLIAARQIYPELFREMHWSAEDVGRTTLDRFNHIGVKVVIVAERHDVDEASDLQFISGWLDQEGETT
jgi:hypothetical protein